MRKNGKVWAAILLILLLAAAVLLLIQCGASGEQEQSSEYITSIGSSFAAGNASTIPGTSSSIQETAVPSSSVAITSPSSAPATSPSQAATQPTTPETKPSQTATEPTKPAASSPVDTSNHTFSEWKWEEYTYTIDYGYSHPGGSQYTTYTSHRKYRTCTKCGYKETSGSDHICQKGSDNHTVTTVKAGTCTTKATMRSTCKVCGWYVEYEGKKGQCNWVDKKVHLSDYGPYTNELDATVSECSSCGDKAITYHRGEGWSDYNRYRLSLSVNSGSAYMAQPQDDNFAAYEHPTWQMVRRDFVYDSEGYVKQFTVYWWYNGTRYSQVIKCGAGEIEAWFAEYGLQGGSGYHHTLRVYGTEIRPYQISWTS